MTVGILARRRGSTEASGRHARARHRSATLAVAGHEESVRERVTSSSRYTGGFKNLQSCWLALTLVREVNHRTNTYLKKEFVQIRKVPGPSSYLSDTPNLVQHCFPYTGQGIRGRDWISITRLRFHFRQGWGCSGHAMGIVSVET